MASPADVDTLLDRMEAEAEREQVRVMADLHYQDGDVETILQVGLGAGSGFVGFVADSGSVISTNGTSDASAVSFDYMTNERTVPTFALVDAGTVRRVVQAFVRSPQQRPYGLVDWRSPEVSGKDS